ncbi:MAG TPA: aminotransferase class V-fold PLP-dependent enzyme [Ktedonobacterales bacterium]|nr:aminotransferase class V-fold PLP-dependent enzyme [Ktedonobacterales bacterium]
MSLFANDAAAEPRAPATDDRAKIAAIRAALPVTERYAYLNTGTNGPLSRQAYEALLACAREELEAGRIGASAFGRMFAGLDEARQAFAALLGCDPDEVALTHNTTEGMNIALHGLTWQPGDEVVTASTEHAGGLYPTYLLHQRHGVRIRMTAIGLPGGDPVEQLRAALSPRTRAVVLSHVSWATGMVLPLAELVELTHQAGALFICDAAQSGGMIPVDVHALGVDAYACSGQKWLCGPDGTGALYVRRDRWAEIQQTYIGYFGVRAGMSDTEGHFVPPASAKRYEAATLSPGGLRALAASLRWIGEEVGWAWAYARIAALGRYCYHALAALDGVTLLTPADRMAGLVHFRVEGIAPADLSAKLEARGILIRHTPSPEANRVATGFYNTEQDIDRLVAAIGEIRSAG